MAIPMRAHSSRSVLASICDIAVSISSAVRSLYVLVLFIAGLNGWVKKGARGKAPSKRGSDASYPPGELCQVLGSAARSIASERSVITRGGFAMR